ncbi:hypothetical protein GXP67_22190 [Rhodocytophaga rosea]|uniref:YHYH domain-containing protein n=1 Tax=Rhodocytophaga rosea TaxID=2704465 RepID=A0A6C0GM93_9BACT|nr:hypothetical protein [Rhodocytophaga rosea]QHT69158.1 hypothetical protein GXP67_22190 [Rhodocytophaga rosea]
MRRSTRLLVGFAAAALTYASLMAFAGPQYRSRHSFHAHGHYSRYHCGNHGSWQREHAGSDSRQENPPVDIPKNQ